MSRASEIRLTLLGGAGEIGASCALVQVADTALLIDCGVRFKAGRPLPDLDLLSDVSLDGILVTHAHTDHTGGLPVIHEAQPGAPILMTPPTLDLVRILQQDALRLMDSASEREGDVPLYQERQVESMLELVTPVHHGTAVTLGDVEVRFLPASHILGASMIHLTTPGGNILFTGDYCVTAQRSVPALDRPSLPVDWLITESTYGNRLHADRQAAEGRLVSKVREVVEGGGRVLIPAFAIGRAQEVLLILRQAIQDGQLPEIPVFVDGMVRSVCGVYGRHPRYATRKLDHEAQKSGHPFFSRWIRSVSGLAARREVLDAGPCVIVASSGMLTGGPSAYYAAELARYERDAILITGYQDEESPGRALLDLAEKRGPRTILLGGQQVDVKCRFESYSLSAHADRMQLMGLAEALQPRAVTLVHGDKLARSQLADSLSCLDITQGEDGRQLLRTFRARRERRPPRQLPPLSPDAVQRLLGPPIDKPLSLDALAEAWFGSSATHPEKEELARALLHSGLVRRDDQRRGILWHTQPTQPSPEDLGDQEVYEGLDLELKQLNPKGKLLELCSRCRIHPKYDRRTPAPGFYELRLTLRLEGQAFDSGFHEGSTPLRAEQKASAALLSLLEAHLLNEPLEEISSEEAARLKLENPKGRLLEYCARSRIAPPAFEHRGIPGGFAGNATLTLPGGKSLTTHRFRAQNARTLEQKLAEVLLVQLEQDPIGNRLDAAPPSTPSAPVRSSEPTTPDSMPHVEASPSPTPIPAAPPNETEEGSTGPRTLPNPPPGGWQITPVGPLTGRDPRIRLNELLQKRVLSSLDFELLEQRGPAHDPLFLVRVQAVLAGGEQIEGGVAEGTPLRVAQKKAAWLLLEQLQLKKSGA